MLSRLLSRGDAFSQGQKGHRPSLSPMDAGAVAADHGRLHIERSWLSMSSPGVCAPAYQACPMLPG